MADEENQVEIDINGSEGYDEDVATAEPVTETGEPVEAEAEGVTTPIGQVKNPMDAMDGWTLLVALLITSIIVFVHSCFIASAVSGNGLTYWALAGSILSIVAVAVLMILKKCAEPVSIKIGPFVMIGLLVLWVCIVFPSTFAPAAPFTGLGNGWIGCWMSLAVSGALAARAFADKAKAMADALQKQSEASEGSKFAIFLAFASVIVLIASCFQFSTVTTIFGFTGCTALLRNDGVAGYAVAVAVISLVCVAVILVFANVASLKQHSGKTNMALSIFLIVWWAIAAFVITFGGPFDGTCGLNGYVGMWISLLAAFSLFKACGLDTVKGLVSKIKAGKGGEGGGDKAAAEDPAL